MFLLWLRQLLQCGDWTPASVPPPAESRSCPTNTPIFPPSSFSYRVLCGSIYSFLLIRYSCPLSVGVLYVLLCLKVYSWCYPWREKYLMSTYSSAILFSLLILLLFYVFTWLVSADVLHALLCLKMYSWCILGERCTPCPPTPLPSYTLSVFSL